MRVVITGASGNVGTSLIEALSEERRVQEIVAVARRLPRREFPRTRWVSADVPLMDSGRARRELGWEPRHEAAATLRELLEGMRRGAGFSNPAAGPRDGRALPSP